MLDFARYTHLTFDCYGTLIDWESGILAALRPVLARHGVALSDDQLLELFGELESAVEAGPYQRYRDVLAAVLDGFGTRFGFTPSAEERATFGGSVADWPAFPDSVEGLRALGERYKLVILSNVDDDLFAHSAQRLQANFADVITAQQIGSYKPNPRNFQFALNRLGVPTEQVLHVAQSLFHDIAPAQQFGLATVWVNRRHDRPGSGATPVTQATPDLEVPDLRTLARLVAAATRAIGTGRVAPMATTADAVVIGGGVVGASALFHLQALGLRRVILCERRQPGAGASGRSGAFLQMHFCQNVPEAELTIASMPYFERWDELVGAGSCGFVPHGLPAPRTARPRAGAARPRGAAPPARRGDEHPRPRRRGAHGPLLAHG